MVDKGWWERMCDVLVGKKNGRRRKGSLHISSVQWLGVGDWRRVSNGSDNRSLFSTQPGFGSVSVGIPCMNSSLFSRRKM